MHKGLQQLISRYTDAPVRTTAYCDEDSEDLVIAVEKADRSDNGSR